MEALRFATFDRPGLLAELRRLSAREIPGRRTSNGAVYRSGMNGQILRVTRGTTGRYAVEYFPSCASC